MQYNITTLIIILNVIASIYCFSNRSMHYKWVFNPYQIKHRGEYYRFITSGFIHADYLHLAFNMFALHGFGGYLEQAFKIEYGSTTGGLLYILLYILAIILADMPSYKKHQENHNYNSLGASGGVSGVLFACILLNPWLSMYIYFIPVRGIFFAILYVWYSIYMGKKNMDNVNHSAHLYGALVGVIFMILAYPGAISGFLEQMINFKAYLF